MKKMIVLPNKPKVYACSPGLALYLATAFFVFAACSNTSSSTDANTEGKNVEPVGIILNPKGTLVGMDIAAVFTPESKHQIVAESLSSAFHNARTTCAAVLKETPSDIFAISDLSIFNGKISSKEALADTNPGIRCLKDALNDASVPKFGDKTHIVDVKIRIRQAEQ